VPLMFYRRFRRRDRWRYHNDLSSLEASLGRRNLFSRAARFNERGRTRQDEIARA